MEGETCAVCFQGSLELQEGMLVCTVCGNIAQGFTQETQEFQVGAGRRKAAGFKSARETKFVEERASFPVVEALHAYVAAMQRLLLSQLERLQEHFQVDYMVKTYAGSIWFRYLEEIDVLKKPFCEDLQKKIESITKSSLQTFNTPSARFEDALSGVGLAIDYSLAILLLACWQTRATVSPLDLVRWAADGQLPYFTFWADNKVAFQPYSKLLAQNVLSPSGPPPPQLLQNTAIEIAAKLQIRCPCIHTDSWLQRYISELQLPVDDSALLLHTAQKLYTLYGEGRPQFFLHYRSTTHPWSHVIALLLIALKFWYKLVGGEWIDWAKNALLRLQPGYTTFPTSMEDAVALSDNPALEEYMIYLRDVVFSGIEPPEELKIYQELFEKIAEDLKKPANEEQEEEGISSMRRTEKHISSSHSQPRDVDPGYEYYGRALGGDLVPLPPAYVAVLVVFSSLVWITPAALHEIVAGLEKDMISSEIEVGAGPTA